jgi:hypothetical protein
LSLCNDVIKVRPPLAYFAREQKGLPDSMKVNYNYNHGKGTLISDKYCCGEHCTPHELYIYIYPLNNNNTIYYVEYSKTWWNPPDCEGDETGAGTFYILEKNQKSGLYEIATRFEKSNFYHEMVQTGKLNDMVQIKRNNYSWSGALETEYDPVTEANGEIRFNTKLKVCDPGGPCYHKMYLYWVYGKDKKLRCLDYLDRYELVNDPESGKLKPSGQRVELAP